MKTDRELLELAAKAAGLRGYIHEWVNGPEFIIPGENPATWNPLQDDGDALRLMARLNINISYRENQHGAWVVAENAEIQFCAESLDGPHEYDATRRVIVRAAAEIQRAKEAT